MAAVSTLLGSVYTLKGQLLLVLIGLVTYQWIHYRKLSQFKGPLWASITNLWMAKSVHNRQAHLDLFHVSEKYGELARVGPNILLTGDPDLVIRMSAARSAYTRADWYSGQKVEVDHNNLFSETNEQIHTKRRAQMAIGFSGKEIPGLEVLIDKHISELIRLIRTKYISTASNFQPMDLARKAAFLTMDVTTDMSFGRTWGCLPRDEDVDKWFETNEEFLPKAIMFSTIPWMAKLFSIPIIGRMVMPSDKDATGAGKLLGVVKEIVSRRLQIPDHEKKQDMMGSFFRHGITEREAVTEATLQIVAGTDTTATIIRATMLYIITNPRIYQTLQAEIDNNPDAAEIVSDEHVKRLPYLQAAIKEGIRMCPPSAGLLSKRTPPEGDTFKGRFIPGNTDIGQSSWALQRSKKVYGEDSMLFRPERWLEAEGETLAQMEKSVGLVWGYGKYMCLGKTIAWLELNKVFYELLRNFDIQLVDPTRPWKSENVGLWLQSEMFVTVTERVKN